MKNIFKAWNVCDSIKAFCALIGGALGKLFGGWDSMLVTLLVLIVLDYLSGVLKSCFTKTLSSEIGYRGIIKKVAIMLSVAVANLIQYVIGNVVPLREIVIAFFIANEALSILENGGAMGIKYPKKLLDILKQLHDDSDEGKMPYDEKNKPPKEVS